MVLFYLLKWIVLVYLTLLVADEVHSERSKIIMFILVIFVAAGFIVEGRREFITRNKKEKN